MGKNEKPSKQSDNKLEGYFQNSEIIKLTKIMTDLVLGNPA